MLGVAASILWWVRGLVASRLPRCLQQDRPLSRRPGQEATGRGRVTLVDHLLEYLGRRHAGLELLDNLLHERGRLCGSGRLRADPSRQEQDEGRLGGVYTGVWRRHRRAGGWSAGPHVGNDLPSLWIAGLVGGCQAGRHDVLQGLDEPRVVLSQRLELIVDLEK